MNVNQKSDGRTEGEAKMKFLENPVYVLVKEVKETYSIDEMVDLLSSGEWVAIGAARGNKGILFSLGRVI